MSTSSLNSPNPSNLSNSSFARTNSVYIASRKVTINSNKNYSNALDQSTSGTYQGSTIISVSLDSKHNELEVSVDFSQESFSALSDLYELLEKNPSTEEIKKECKLDELLSAHLNCYLHCRDRATFFYIPFFKPPSMPLGLKIYTSYAPLIVLDKVPPEKDLLLLVTSNDFVLSFASIIEALNKSPFNTNTVFVELCKLSTLLTGFQERTGCENKILAFSPKEKSSEDKSNS